MFTAYIKHMGSCAADLPLEYRIDAELKRVEVKAKHFDSALLDTFAHRLLLENHAIQIIRDDSSGWNPARPEWRLFLDMSLAYFEVEFIHLLPLGTGGRYTVVLLPAERLA